MYMACQWEHNGQKTLTEGLGKEIISLVDITEIWRCRLGRHSPWGAEGPSCCLLSWLKPFFNIKWVSEVVSDGHSAQPEPPWKSFCQGAGFRRSNADCTPERLGDPVYLHVVVLVKHYDCVTWWKFLREVVFCHLFCMSFSCTWFQGTAEAWQQLGAVRFVPPFCLQVAFCSLATQPVTSTAICSVIRLEKFAAGCSVAALHFSAVDVVSNSHDFWLCLFAYCLLLFSGFYFHTELIEDQLDAQSL